MNQLGEDDERKMGGGVVVDLKKPVYFEHAWCLWFDRYIGRGFTAHEYADAIKEVFVVKTIQEFWRWYNNLPGAAELDPSCTYHLMKNGIRPLWEDPGNVRGGNLTAKISCKDANEVWLRLCLLAISGQLDHFLAKCGDQICGVSIGMRKTDAAIYLWNADAKAFDQPRMLLYLEEALCGGGGGDGGAVASHKSFGGEKSLKSSLYESAVYKVHQSLDNFGNEQPHDHKPKAKEEDSVKAIEGGAMGGKKKTTQKRPIYEPVRVPIEKKHLKPRKMDMKVLREKKKNQVFDVPI
jgi:hypothetical protein